MSPTFPSGTPHDSRASPNMTDEASGTNTGLATFKDQPSRSKTKTESRSPSRTSHTASSPMPPPPVPYDSRPRNIDEVIDTVRSTFPARPRGHSASAQQSPPILQSSSSSSSQSQSPHSQPRLHQSHVSFPEPSIKSTSSSGAAIPAQPAHASSLGKGPSPLASAARASEMSRVASLPLPVPSTSGSDSNPSSRTSSVTRADHHPSRGRTFSFSRSSTKSRGSSPSGQREWFSRLPSSLMRRGRPRAGSGSSTLTTKSVNVAEVTSHRVTTAGDITSGPTIHSREGTDDVFAWNAPHAENPRTVDAGYGYDDAPALAISGEEDDEEDEELVPRGKWFRPESHRPWSSSSVSGQKGSPKLGATKHSVKKIPEDESFRITKEKVLRATSYIEEGAHDLLAMGAEVLEFAPIPGLATAAHVLLTIWDAAQEVDLNRKACLRLTERCATILISVREEIEQADNFGAPQASPTLLGSPRTVHLPTPPSGPSPLPGGKGSGKGVHSSPKPAFSHPSQGSLQVDSPKPETSPQQKSKRLWGEELDQPMERLIAAFHKVLGVLQKQNSRPFLKRYLKREEIALELEACHSSLTDILHVFEIAIQVRILKHVIEAEQQRQAETAALFDHIRYSPASSYANSPSSPPVMPGFHPGLLSSSPSSENGLGLEGMPHPMRLDSVGVPNLLDLDSAAYEPPTEISFPVPVHYPVIPTIPEDPSKMTSQDVIKTITELAEVQNTHDMAYDTAALRQLLRKVVATNDDYELLNVLQVRKEEMPQAIKALQRALESEIMKEWEEKEREKREGASVLGGKCLTSPVEDAAVVGNIQDIVEGVLGDRMARARGGQERTAAGTSSQSVEEQVPSKRPIADSRADRSSRSNSSGGSRDTLDREFIESSIESLLRLSTSEGAPPASLSLPSWTITRYELMRHVKIGQGNFSEVWRGSYRKRTVAIKVLAPWTPRELFLKEVVAWDRLRHPNVLELIGASACDATDYIKPGSSRSGGLESSVYSSGAISTSSGWDVPEEARSPWFFVSRYYERGSLVKWLKGIDQSEWNLVLDDAGQGALRLIHEIVRGMVYLHKEGVFHGDLKCANILVNDFGHCIISDFGQSEMKSETSRLSGKPMPHGTLRWQAPELMSGASNLTAEVDVYAFAVSCVELLTKGSVPWFMASDDTVRHLVLDQDKRPEPPMLRQWSQPLIDIIRRSWAKSPQLRPTFEQLDQELKLLRHRFGWNGVDVVQEGEIAHEKGWEQWIDWLDKEEAQSPSLSIIPLPLQGLPSSITTVDVPPFMHDSGSFVTARGPSPNSDLTDGSEAGSMYRKNSVSEPMLPHLPLPEDIGATHSAPEPARPRSPHLSHYSSRASSIGYPPSIDRFDDGIELSRSLELRAANPRYSEIRNERRYRLTLQHEYHPSLILPLWTPTPIFIGDVGYHRKPSGTFVTLFNAFRPSESPIESIRRMSSISGYAQGTELVIEKEEKLEKRTVAKRAMDLIQGWLSRSKMENSSARTVGRRYSAQLRNGHKASYLFTESTTFHFINDASPAKRWFQVNIDEIMNAYGREHPIQREDVILVICTLDAPNYAMFVSHKHPDSQVNFNVFATSKPGQPWGQFSVTPDPATVKHGGPVFHEKGPGSQSATKVSVTKQNPRDWDTVLLARLRFAPDMDEPTSK